MSARHLLMLILMVYVSVLNIMLVNSLFGKYLSKYTVQGRQSFKDRLDETFQGKVKLRPSSQSRRLEKLRHLQTGSGGDGRIKSGVLTGCPEDDFTYIIGLVPGPPDLSVHNDMASHRNLQIMSELRHVLRHDRQAKAHVYVFLSTETFLAAHRTWCQILPEQTSQRASCELVLLQVGAANGLNSLLFSHVLEKEKCLRDFILLHDSAHIGPSFLARIQGASRHKATCLAASADTQHCPLPAFRLPRAFLVAWLWNKYDASMSIEAAAAEFHLWGGGVTAVGT